MLKIRISTIDKLHELTAQLGVVTYLQSLIQYDEADDVIGDDELKFAHEFAKAFLSEVQYNAVAKLRALVISNDFAVSDNNIKKPED